jgi:hypothetical protein
MAFGIFLPASRVLPSFFLNSSFFLNPSLYDSPVILGLLVDLRLRGSFLDLGLRLGSRRCARNGLNWNGLNCSRLNWSGLNRSGLNWSGRLLGRGRQ